MPALNKQKHLWVNQRYFVTIFLTALLFFLSNIPNKLFAKKFEIRKTIEWEYSIKYHNMPATSLKIFCEPEPKEEQFYKIRVFAKTHGVFSYLFKIDNYYETLLQTESFLPVVFTKKINQKNIKQSWTMRYLENKAIIDTSRQWEVPEMCHNYFSMLFFLRSQPLLLDEKYVFFLDVEYLCWRVIATVAPIETLEISSNKIRAIKLILQYENIYPDRKERPWKTDLLTNRIAGKSKTMNLWYSADSERILLKVVYDENTSMQLKQIK